MPTPNIILCMCDQMRAFEVGCYGNRHIRTPNIDRLAALGTRFELAVTPNPVCTPARSSVLTGQYSRTCTGMLGNVARNPPNPRRERLVDPALPELLRDAGHRTALIGKWHIDPQPPLVGFDTAVYPMVAHRYYGQTYFNERAEPFVVREFGAEWEQRQVQAFLREHASQDHPFFLFYNISPPHQPIGPGHLPERYTSMYDPAQVPLRPNTRVDGNLAYSRRWFNIYASADYYWRSLRGDEQNPNDIVPDDFGLRDLTALYYGACTCVDDMVGGLMGALKENGLLDNTIVVFTSDHGDNLGSHGLFNKDSLIEEAIRVPFVVRDPRLEPGVNTSQVTSLIDVMPTLLELAGLPVPEHVQGQSLAPLIRRDSTVLVRNTAFIETGPMIAARTPTHLYGTHFVEEERSVVPGDEWFYDLSRDPCELRNLAATDEQGPLASRLRAELMRWDRETPWLDAPALDVDGRQADRMVDDAH